jgi:hypothetical protein
MLVLTWCTLFKVWFCYGRSIVISVCLMKIDLYGELASTKRKIKASYELLRWYCYDGVISQWEHNWWRNDLWFFPSIKALNPDYHWMEGDGGV